MTAPAADFIAANTIIDRPALTPEIALHLATEVTPLWHATADRLADSGVDAPFWAFAWPGGQALARYVLDHPETVAGRRVLDVGTGSGLVAIAAAKAGAASVVANDIDYLSLSAAALNATFNGVAVTTSGDDLIGLAMTGSWDVILAGDVFYDRNMAARLTPWLGAQATAGSLVLIGDPDRPYLPIAHLERLTVYRVETSLDLEAAKSLKTAIWRFL